MTNETETETGLPNDGVFKYQGYTFAPDAITTFNLFVLTQQGITHKMGNECAARLSAWSKTNEGKDASEDEKATKLKEFRDEMSAKILANEKLGTRGASGAARVTGDEALKRAITLDVLKDVLDKQSKRTGNKVTVPTGDATITIAGKAMNREQLLDATARKFVDRIEAEFDRRKAFKSEGEDVGEEVFAE
jgi:hypothetical protein